MSRPATQEPRWERVIRHIAPGLTGLELVVVSGAERTLIVRDAQHEYVFAES